MAISERHKIFWSIPDAVLQEVIDRRLEEALSEAPMHRATAAFIFVTNIFVSDGQVF